MSHQLAQDSEVIDLLVIGGGAAGYFAALAAGQSSPGKKIVLVESGAKPLRKVAISGGGRCNVTHHCFDPHELTRAYPRGSKELRGSFTRFQPKDTVEWFESRGVALKTESDGRMFPVTDSSQTIISCLENERKKLGIDLLLKHKVKSVLQTESQPRYQIDMRYGSEKVTRFAHAVVLCTGSAPQGFEIGAALRQELTPRVPSLFSFEIADARLDGLAGIAIPDGALSLSIDGCGTLRERGPVLITHWGLSGPAVIKLSSWAAKSLAAVNYCTSLTVNWLPSVKRDEIIAAFSEWRKENGKLKVPNSLPFDFPKRFWNSLLRSCAITSDDRWGELRRIQHDKLVEQISAGRFQISGKGVFKEEFVTCGGVALAQIDFRTMQSKTCPGLYFAGEILDIDGITGGFNFQSAWTTGWLAGRAAVMQ